MNGYQSYLQIHSKSQLRFFRYIYQRATSFSHDYVIGTRSFNRLFSDTILGQLTHRVSYEERFSMKERQAKFRLARDSLPSNAP